MTRRLILAATFLLAACGDPDDRPIAIASGAWVGYEPLFLARNEGWLDAGRVRLFETTSATDSLQVSVASQLLAQGAHKLFDSRQIPNTIVDVLALRSEVLDRRHAAAIRHLVATHFRALEYLNRNPHDAAYRMAAHLGLHETEVLPVFKGLLLPDAANNRRMLSGSTPELLITARKVSTLMTEEKLLPRDDSFIALIRAEFLPAALP